MWGKFSELFSKFAGHILNITWILIIHQDFKILVIFEMILIFHWLKKSMLTFSRSHLLFSNSLHVLCCRSCLNTGRFACRFLASWRRPSRAPTTPPRDSRNWCAELHASWCFGSLPLVLMLISLICDEILECFARRRRDCHVRAQCSAPTTSDSSGATRTPRRVLRAPSAFRVAPQTRLLRVLSFSSRIR